MSITAAYVEPSATAACLSRSVGRLVGRSVVGSVSSSPPLLLSFSPPPLLLLLLLLLSSSSSPLLSSHSPLAFTLVLTHTLYPCGTARSCGASCVRRGAGAPPSYLLPPPSSLLPGCLGVPRCRAAGARSAAAPHPPRPGLWRRRVMGPRPHARHPVGRWVRSVRWVRWVRYILTLKCGEGGMHSLQLTCAYAWVARWRSPALALLDARAHASPPASLSPARSRIAARAALFVVRTCVCVWRGGWCGGGLWALGLLGLGGGRRCFSAVLLGGASRRWVEHTTQTHDTLGRAGEVVLDPMCGRGTFLFEVRPSSLRRVERVRSVRGPGIRSSTHSRG